MSILSFITAFLLTSAPAAHAQSLTDVINAISNAEPVSDATFPGIVLFLRTRMLLMIDFIALFLLVRAGLKLINSQDDDKLTKAKRTIGATAVGIMLAHLSVRLVEIFYYGPLPAPGGEFVPIPNGGVLNPEVSVTMLSLEIGGIVNWVTTLVAVLGVLMIVATGMRAIGSFGKEDGLKHLKETVFGTVTGIFFLIISGAIKATFGLPTDATPGGPVAPTTLPIILRIGQVTNSVLHYMTIIAVAVVIYAGFLMIVSLGDEERFKKGKTLIFRALLGLVIILLSTTFARLIMSILS